MYLYYHVLNFTNVSLWMFLFKGCFPEFEIAPLKCVFVNMFPFLRMSQGQNVYVLGGIEYIGGINPVNMFIDTSLFS